jgi:hypothetical protein
MKMHLFFDMLYFFGKKCLWGLGTDKWVENIKVLKAPPFSQQQQGTKLC